jgi:hypothetical protein
MHRMKTPLDLEWRGKSVRLLTPDEVAAFATWAHNEIGRLREEREAYLTLALTVEAALGGEGAP